MSQLEARTLGQLKILILNRIEERLFQLDDLLCSDNRYAADAAIWGLWNTWALIPPDIKRDLSEYERKLEHIIYKEIPRYSVGGHIQHFRFDRLGQLQRKVGVANRYRSWLRIVVGKVQDLLYKRYLVEEPQTSFFNPSKGKKSGEGKHDGFSRRVPARV